jgi:xanthine dehydrogenase large subunit
VTHAAGLSEYVDDRPMLRNELYVGLVYSPHAKARISHLDISAAYAIPGVAAVITAKDVVSNHWGTIFQDQPIIAESEVNFVGEVVAVVAAETKDAMLSGCRAVRVQYEKQPAILSINDAISQKCFIGNERDITRGDVGQALATAPRRLRGTLIIQGADHFYLENQASIAYPREQGQIEVHSSTQHPTETQHVVAKACGLQFNQVVCVVKRLGGGFGGKESQAAPIAAYAALVAKKTGRPARLVLTKDDDMIITGKRNPFQIEYEVGYQPDGLLLGLKARLYSDGGAYADLSTAIMERAMLHCDNAYFIPHVEVRGIVCRTNMHPHTAFRGFGGPKGVALIEGIIEQISNDLGIDSLVIRRLNCYRPGFDITHYGQKVENNLLPQLFAELETDCNYQQRRSEIDAWNAKLKSQPSKLYFNANPRGLSMTAVKFGISFTTRFLNQGNALVSIHTDGTIQVSTGAVEMGQGVNVRIAQLVAEQFGLPLSAVLVMATSTEKNANTSPTAASSGTDINGAAAVQACQVIRQRLAALALKLAHIPPEKWASKTAGLGTQAEISVSPDIDVRSVRFADGKVLVGDGPTSLQLSFAELVREAYLNRISLSEYAFFRIPNLGFDKVKGQGRAFLYFTQGVCASEVEIDRFTGEVKVLRVDLLMDLGRPINHALDVGQVTGGFVQGMGWVTTENLYYNKDGFLVSHSPSTYKIPSIQDTPRTFNVDLIHNEGNTENVRGTKAVGEPPLLLAISVWTSVQNALGAVDLDFRRLSIPATAEQVMRCMRPSAFAQEEARG